VKTDALVKMKGNPSNELASKLQIVFAPKLVIFLSLMVNNG